MSDGGVSSAGSSYYWYWILTVTALALIAIGSGAWKRRLRTWQPYAAAVAILAVLAGTWFRTHVQPWQTLVAFLPTLIILYHSFNLWRERPLQREGPAGGATWERGLVEAEIDAYYGAGAITARYVLPALLLPIVGLWQFAYVEGGSRFHLALTDGSLWPFEYGLFGAYVFVFMELGKRGVRNDITPVAVLWCLTTLVLGPALAALLPSVFAGQQDATWGERAVWIFAGYSPRVVFRALERGVRRTLFEEEPIVREERRIPLERVSGIGMEEAERLAEEGIKDVHGLACVDPIRLMRDTRFDKWRILAWVDQALLISWVQEGVWRELLKRGYQGASDVSALVGPVGVPGGRTMSDAEAQVILREIAHAAQTKEPVLKDELTRLIEDLRTRSLRALARYVLEGIETQPQGPTPDPHAPPASPSSPAGPQPGVVATGPIVH